ncbi:hypothetical protein HZZ00_11110 [Streptomyces sp. NEAU-sy36]|uniref:hypothetical protein n=1 Tax=unclassified Streptomyces TaxID=2593676 RepID=UPI0015D6596D|nr:MULTISPECIES: hypothetical protein [unclassified Streptomyces]QLJ01520.1 hypothetical protein HZZ00_11110 [Streptomyces sp. NEAU-sy36]
MLRIIAVALLGLYLIAIGLWPPAAAPIAAALTGAAVLVGLVPGPIWLGLGAIAWHRNRKAVA